MVEESTTDGVVKNGVDGRDFHASSSEFWRAPSFLR